jgi:KDEL-tailed cysteine endopeptidase
MKTRFTCLLAILLSLQIILCSEHHAILDKFLDGPKKELFKVYHQIFNKQYNLNTEEGLHRYKVFKENLKWIKEENKKGHAYELGITEFTDLTNEEYRLALFKEGGDFLLEDSNFKSEQIYGEGEVIVDHSSHFGPIKDQMKTCSGGDWAFALVGTIEGNYSKKFGVKLSLSEQHLIDCDTSNANGCTLGYPSTGYDFPRANGIFRDTDYPYTGSKGKKCLQKESSPVYKIPSILIKFKRMLKCVFYFF